LFKQTGSNAKECFFVGDDRKLKRGNLFARILFSRAAIEMEEEGLLCLSPGTLRATIEMEEQGNA